jgi:hypothetical protein
MINGGVLEAVPIDRIVLDTTNPRIRKFIEMYGDNPGAEQIFLALGAGGDDVNAGEATTFEKLRSSIRTNGGVIQPVILNRRSDGTLPCIEGNTAITVTVHEISRYAARLSGAVWCLVYQVAAPQNGESAE